MEKDSLENRLQTAWKTCCRRNVVISPSFSCVPSNEDARQSVQDLANLIMQSRKNRQATNIIPPRTREMILFAANRDTKEGFGPSF